MRHAFCIALVAVVCAGVVRADDSPSTTPKVIPQTRPEMKKALEALKRREPRLPLTELGAEQREPFGDRPIVNNARMRALYLPKSWMSQSSGGQSQDPRMTLDEAFKVKLFWLVSRDNNCHYCLGHQEHKLRNAGLIEDEIAALDCKWEAFPPAEQAAFAFTQKITLRPHEIGRADIELLRKHFSDSQIIEIVYTVAGYNSTNRWTDSMGLPQDEKFRGEPNLLDTPTSPEFADQPTKVIAEREIPRPKLEDQRTVEALLAQARTRQASVKLPAVEAAREALGELAPYGAIPNWMLAISEFAQTAQGFVKTRQALENDGRISPMLKAQLAWITARQNRAWYAAGHAQRRLLKLGADSQAAYELDGDLARFTLAEQAAFRFARKLTTSPRSIVDADIAALRKLYSDHEVAEIVHTVCASNMFDRYTEALQLPLE
jgi:alkylhydroperoxidase family enzyme